MRSGRFGATRRDVLRLFEGGSVAGLSDGELLDRFALTGDEAAFEALVTKLGPMVLGVCRRMLVDSHDVDDAFQATFLVLVRRARSIRDRELVAAWLHGVATKVARRARVDSARRAVRERGAVAPEAREEAGSNDFELRAAIDAEIERLPENHRRPVILCDVEGLTREEAALRLGWSLNMVRGRLERARERLRSRLTRRGLAPSGSSLALLTAAPNLSQTLISATSRAALAFGVGRVGAGLATASAVALFQGVSQMMLLSKLKMGLAVVLTMGFVGGTGMLAAQGPGQKPDPAKPAAVLAPAPVVQAPAKVDATFQPRGAADLAKARIDAAQKRLDAQMAFYKEGEITIDRLIDASDLLMHAKLDDAQTKASRIEIVRSHYELLNQLLKKEEAELAVGRATQADLTEVKSRILDAEFFLARELAAPETKAINEGIRSLALTKLATERVELARRIFENSQELYRNARIELSPYLDACQALLVAEEAAATTKAERIRAVQEQIKSLKNALAITEAMHQAARTTIVNVDRVRLKILDAEAHLIEVSEASSPDDAVITAPLGSNLIAKPEALKASDATTAERVEIARRNFKDAQRRYPGEIEIMIYLSAWRDQLEAEEAAATVPAGRIEVIQKQIKILEDALAVMENLIKQGERRQRDADKIRINILGERTRLAGITRAPVARNDEQIEAARKSYDSVFDETVDRFVNPGEGASNKLNSILNRETAELFYLWSRRWMEAQRDAGENPKASEIAAFEGHLSRMKDLERGRVLEVVIVKLKKTLTHEQLLEELNSIPEFQTAIKFYRLEAEAWLAKAKAR